MTAHGFLDVLPGLIGKAAKLREKGGSRLIYHSSGSKAEEQDEREVDRILRKSCKERWGNVA